MSRLLFTVPAILALGVSGLVAPAGSAASLPESPSVRYTAELQIDTRSAVVTTDVAFRVNTTPAAKSAGRTVLLQIDAGTRWRTIERARAGSDGVATGSFTSTTTGPKRYRAVLINAGDGRTLARSTVATVTWTKLTLSPRLLLSRTTAPVRQNVPYSVTVTPAAAAAGLRVAIQVMGRTSWQAVDVLRLNKSGRAAGTVEGYAPGLGRYRARVLSGSGKVLATSPTVSISYTTA